jgi:hypothetical protein
LFLGEAFDDEVFASVDLFVVVFALCHKSSPIDGPRSGDLCEVTIPHIDPSHLRVPYRP